MDYKRFAARKVVIHEIPQRFVGGVNQQLDLSGVAEKLTGQLRPFFDRKLKASLSAHGFDVARDPAGQSTIPDRIVEILQDPKALVSASQQMAEHLHAVQTGVNSAGLLCVATGTCGSRPAVAVLKLERDEGARLRRRGKGSQRSLAMTYLDDLMVTGKTRILKASVFEMTGTTANSLDGRVADDQRGPGYGHDVSSFFLSQFLGCKLRVEPRIATRDLFTATEEFINEAIPSPERKAQYTLSLLAQMHAPAADVRPRKFSEDFFETEDQTPYRDFLKARDIDPDQPVKKDLSLIENRITRVKMETEEGLMLLGRAELIDERVDVRDNQIVIRDQVVTTRGG
ncbi:MAG TPA: nucleoid-associated protein [Solirubrobacterales bacterium]